MTIYQAQRQLTAQLKTIYDEREAFNIADWVMEHITGAGKVERMMYKNERLDNPELLERYTRELLAHKPVQYVLNQAWFAGMRFYVNEEVLIPRPETEELVEWVAAEAAPGAAVLDVGTGSGCIAIALKKKMQEVLVYACDVSAGAIAVAEKNAGALGTEVHFIQVDFLDEAEWLTLPKTDVIVSNPPYIPEHNQAAMQPNVLQYEPHVALFVADHDPLLFYRAIAEFAEPGTRVYVEIHEDWGQQTKALFEGKGFKDVELRKDMQGKHRMVRATR
jgi:protein-(glutamine-N5) methyltransferase, release factor-specific